MTAAAAATNERAGDDDDDGVDDRLKIGLKRRHLFSAPKLSPVSPETTLARSLSFLTPSLPPSLPATATYTWPWMAEGTAERTKEGGVILRVGWETSRGLASEGAGEGAVNSLPLCYAMCVTRNGENSLGGTAEGGRDEGTDDG